MNSELGIRNSELGKCHPERNAVRRGVEGSIRLVGALVALLAAFLLTACTDYQAEFEESFGALEYIGEEYVSSDANHHGGVSGSGDGVTSSAIPGTSAADNPSSSGEGTSVADNPSSSGTGTSAADIPGSSATDNVSSSGVNPASGSDTVVDGSSSSKTSSSSAKSSSSSALVPLSSYNPPRVAYGTLHDNRDGKDYRTIKLGSLTWMAQNLNYELLNSDSVYCYQNESMYCDHFGRLYVWSDAYNGACPAGWRLPDSLDWEDLFQYIKGKKEAGKKLKSNAGWYFSKTTQHDGNGDDRYGFSALPAGFWSYDGDHWWGSLTSSANFWTAKSKNSDSTYSVRFEHNTDSVRVDLNRTRDYAFSVRCVMGTLSSSSVTSSSSVKSSSSSFGSSGRFSYVSGGENFDADYVTFNGLVWMDEDLRLKGSGYCSNGEVCNPHNLFTKSEAENACPQGWRLPTSDEFNNSNNLENRTLNGDTKNVFLGYFLYKDWMEEDKGAMYWTKTKNGDTVDVIMVKYGYYYSKIVRVVQTEVDASLEFAIRCVRGDLASDYPRPTSSPSVTFALQPIRNQNGNVITVRIGDMEWMAENLKDGLNLGGKCSNGNTSNCDAKGLFYTYEEALLVNNNPIQMPDIGDEHWRLPGRADIEKLRNLVGSDNYKGLLSFEMGGTNEFGFNVIQSGYYNENGVYNSFYEEACFWLFTEDAPSGRADAACFKKDGAVEVTTLPKNERHPVRFLWTETY